MQYATYQPAGIYQLDNGHYRKVAPCSMSPNHTWLVFETPGGFIIDNNVTGTRQTATIYPHMNNEVGYDYPLGIPAYVRRAIRTLAKESPIA